MPTRKRSLRDGAKMLDECKWDISECSEVVEAHRTTVSSRVDCYQAIKLAYIERYSASDDKPADYDKNLALITSKVNDAAKLRSAVYNERLRETRITADTWLEVEAKKAKILADADIPAIRKLAVLLFTDIPPRRGSEVYCLVWSDELKTENYINARCNKMTLRRHKTTEKNGVQSYAIQPSEDLRLLYNKMRREAIARKDCGFLFRCIGSQREFTKMIAEMLGFTTTELRQAYTTYKLSTAAPGKRHAVATSLVETMGHTHLMLYKHYDLS